MKRILPTTVLAFVLLVTATPVQASGCIPGPCCSPFKLNIGASFHISGTQQNLETGSWTVQLFVNGNPGPTANFQIR